MSTPKFHCTVNPGWLQEAPYAELLAALQDTVNPLSDIDRKMVAREMYYRQYEEGAQES